MRVEDAKEILSDVLEYEVCDSIIESYKSKDSVSQEVITIQKSTIEKLTDKTIVLEEINTNLKIVVNNKDELIAIKDEIIKEKDKEIKKQKRLKILGFIGSIVLPIITAIIIL
jgi:hypothetical protein